MEATVTGIVSNTLKVIHAFGKDSSFYLFEKLILKLLVLKININLQYRNKFHV